MANKVKFNIREVHYAKRTETGHATPVALPGAVSIALEPQGERSPFYADGVEYYVSNANTGYEGDLEVALIDDDFRKEILGEVADNENVLFESANVEPTHFAFGFTIDGNDGPVKFWFYNCTATRPATNAETNTETKEPKTDSITITAIPNEDGYVRAKSTATTTASVLEDWYSSVVDFTPVTPPEPQEGNL